MQRAAHVVLNTYSDRFYTASMFLKFLFGRCPALLEGAGPRRARARRRRRAGRQLVSEWRDTGPRAALCLPPRGRASRLLSPPAGPGRDVTLTRESHGLRRPRLGRARRPGRAPAPLTALGSFLSEAENKQFPTSARVLHSAAASGHGSVARSAAQTLRPLSRAAR